jgi:hypothetical protein
VHFGLGGQSTYTTQDVVRKTDINEMKQYITANLNINVKNDASYKKLLTGILTRMNTTLFNSQMMNIIVPVITNFPNMKQLTVGEYNKDLQRSQQIYDVIVRKDPLPRTVTGKLKRYELQDEINE